MCWGAPAPQTPGKNILFLINIGIKKILELKIKIKRLVAPLLNLVAPLLKNI